MEDALIQARADIREEIDFVQRICDSYVTHGGKVAFRLRARLQKIYEELLALDCSEFAPPSPSHKESQQ